MDDDGLNNVSYAYQWIRVDDNTETNISGATASTHTLVAADLGTTVKVRVTVTDDASNAETLTSAATATVSAAPNTLPLASNGTVTTNEDSAHTFIASEFNFSDADGDTLSNVRIVTLPASGKGTLALSGTPVTANQVVAATNIGTLAYTPPANANGTGYASFTFKVNDGTAESAADYTMTITVTAVNDAPTVANTITDQPATVGTAFSYAFPANTFSDADTGDTLTYAATKADGATLPTWLSFAAGTRTFSGTPQTADAGTVSVKVTASDGNGGSVSGEFDITVSAAANNLATGAPTITGTAQVGQTLTAGTTGIMDDDGLNNVSYAYQWIRVDGGTETNISGTTASTHTLVAADQGTTIKVKVSFTDDASNPETLTSAATAAVSAAPNTPATGAPTITGTAQVGQTLTAGTTAIMDADGLTSVSYTYQWIRVDDNTETNISGATASTHTLVAADQGTTIKVTVSFTDQASNPETLTSAATAAVSAAPNTPATDRAALVALYNATGGATWKNKTNWLTDEALSEWQGVTTDMSGRVTRLYLNGNELSGEIPAELGNLTSLQFLYLNANELSGEIPAELGNLTSLQFLYLNGNELSGEIPTELGDLTNLQQLSLWGNELSGEIPAELGNLTSLQLLFLSQNMLSGEIPAKLGDLTNLLQLYLNANELSGEIPAELGSLTSLQTLILHSNQLSGEIPEELGDLANLQTLYLSRNQLSGEIPAELGDLANLLQLYLNANELSGEIPAELGDLAELQRLYLNSNELTGEIPSWLMNLTGLLELSLWSNQLTGMIPPEVAPAQDRAALRVLYNATGGANWTDNTNWLSNEPLSEWYGVSTDEQGRVDELRLSANGLTGTIGAELGVLTRLTGLYLNDNELTGTIPPELANLTQLQVFDIRNTGLCVTAGSELQAWLWTINFQGCGARPPRSPGGGGSGGGGGGAGGPSQTVPGAPTNLVAVATDGAVTLRWEAPEADGPTAITDYEYGINGTGWTAIGSTDTTHTVTGLVNDTVYVFQVRAVNLNGRSPASDPVEVTPRAAVALDFAHFANGADITSDIVLVNVASYPTRPALYFYDPEGQLIDPESLVDIMGDLEITEDGSLSVLTEMAPLGELTISTHGRGELVSGSVKVVAEGPIGGVLRFDIPGIGVAGVGASKPVNDALFPASRQAGGITTAAALHNLGAEAMGVNCLLMSGGTALEAVEIPLEANGQTAWFIDEVFTATDTSDFLGSVRCTAPGRGRFTAIAVEMDAAGGIFTTLPVVEVNRGRAEATTLDFAHFANGTWITDLVFVNLETRPSGPPLTPFHTAILPSRPVIYFYDTDGNPIAPELLVDITGDLEVTEDGGLTVQTEMAPLGVLTISTHGRGELVSGSVKVVSEGPIGGMLRFEHPALGVAGVGASRPVSDAIVPVRRQEGGITTGVALHNLESSPELVRCELRQAGVLLDVATIPLEANGQTAWLINQTFPSADTSDFVGSVRCAAVGEGLFTGAALELDPVNRIFTTLPVVAVMP